MNVTGSRALREGLRIEMAKHSLFREFVYFVKTHKAYWMIPLFAVLIVLAILAVVAESSPLAPFLYPLF